MNSQPSIHSIPEREEPELHRLLDRALGKARSRGEPVLLSFEFPFECGDLLRLTEGCTEPSGFRFYWEHSASAFTLAAGGIAQRFLSQGARRFHHLAEGVEPALRNAVSGTAGGDPGSGPYALGGFSFFDTLNSSDWPGFGAGQLVIPAWMVVRNGGSTVALVTLVVTAGDSPVSLLRSLEEIRTRLRAEPKEGEKQRNCAFHLEERGDGKEQWMEVLRYATRQIRAGRLSKVVLARALDLVCVEAPSPYDLLGRLRSSYPDCYNFLVDPGEGQVFLGATPERLARFDNGSVELAAMAGTVPRGASAEADEAQARYLFNSRKEREEHQIVVDGILASLEGLGEVLCPANPELVKLNNLHHLYTPISLKPNRAISVLSLLQVIHPTAAVGGHPREQAFRLIRECERFERGWYGAPVGWMNARGKAEFAVALRSGVLRENRLQLFAGGGIVADSDPGREFEETQLKFQPLLASLADE